MANNPLTTQDLIDIALNPLDGVNQFPQGYVLASPPMTPGPVLYRLFDAAYISTGTINVDRLGTGAVGTGNRYLADDNTWKTIASAGGSLPAGGSTGQILAKVDNTDYNVTWIDNYANWTSQVKHEVKAGVVLVKGQAVYVSDSDGTNIVVSKASNSAESTSSKTMGLIAQDLAVNGKGFVVSEGLLSGLDTSTATLGAPVWLGTNGNLIYGLANKPVAPAHLVYLGVVTRVNSSNGEIFVKVQNGFELDELHDVLITSKTDKDILSYESSSGLWKNKSFTALFGGTPLVSIPTLDQVTTVGNSTTNAITVGGINTSATIKPTVDSSYDLGTGTLRWGAVYTRAVSSGVNSLDFQTGTNLNFQNTSGTAFGRITGATGNWSIGTFTDAGYRLDVNGTTRFQGASTFTGSVTAASAIARGTYLNQTLVAAANNDVLVGLDIAPTFTNGAFTGVSNYGIRVQKTALFNDTWANSQAIFGQSGQAGLIKIARGDNASYATLGFGSATGAIFYINSTFTTIIQNNGTDAIAIASNGVSINAPFPGSPLIFASNNVKYGQFFGTTGNFTLQNGGTFTDAGYRMDVNGTTRLNGAVTITGVTNIMNTLGLNGINQNNLGFMYPYFKTLTLSSATADSWYKIATLGAAPQVLKFKIETNGDNTLSADEFIVASSGYNFQMNIMMLPSAMYNTSKLAEIRAINPSGLGTVEIWIKISANTLTTTIGVYGTIALENLVGTTTAPTNAGGWTALAITPALRGQGINLSRGIVAGGTIAVTGGNITTDQSIQVGNYSSSKVLGFGGWNNFIAGDNSSAYLTFGTNGNQQARIFSSGNVLLQTGGTYTDAGYRLDVNGTARIQSKLTVVQNTSGQTIQEWYNSTTLRASINDVGALYLQSLEANDGPVVANSGTLSTVVGWTGTINILTNPPGQQNIMVDKGIIVNVF